MRGWGRRPMVWVLTLTVAAALVAGSCSGDGDEEGQVGGSDRTSPTSKPSGEPVVIGFVNLEGTPVGGPAPGLRVGSEAARKYVNAELEGLHGRPLEFEVCLTSGSPESSAACANRMVERRVVAVLGGVDLGSAASLPILAAAGIPYIGMTPLLPSDLTTDGAFTLDPGGLGTAANAVYAVDELQARRVAVLHDDSAQGKQLAEAFVRSALLKRGVPAESVKLVAEKAETPDMAPAVAAATQGKPDAVIVVFPAPACSRVMQAAAALGVKAHMLYIGRCSDPRVLAAGGAGAEGAYFFSAILNPDANPDDADVELYREKVDEFADAGADPASYDVARGFATTMTMYRRLLSLDPSELVPASVSAAFRSAVSAPAFMGHPYTCDGRQAVTGFVSVCNTHVRIYQFTKGRYRDASGEWISAGAALTG